MVTNCHCQLDSANGMHHPKQPGKPRANCWIRGGRRAKSALPPNMDWPYPCTTKHISCITLLQNNVQGENATRQLWHGPLRGWQVSLCTNWTKTQLLLATSNPTPGRKIADTSRRTFTASGHGWLCITDTAPWDTRCATKPG